MLAKLKVLLRSLIYIATVWWLYLLSTLWRLVAKLLTAAVLLANLYRVSFRPQSEWSETLYQAEIATRTPKYTLESASVASERCTIRRERESTVETVAAGAIAPGPSLRVNGEVPPGSASEVLAFSMARKILGYLGVSQRGLGRGHLQLRTVNSIERASHLSSGYDRSSNY